MKTLGIRVSGMLSLISFHRGGVSYQKKKDMLVES